jgi:hypothetical protein
MGKESERLRFHFNVSSLVSIILWAGYWTLYRYPIQTVSEGIANPEQKARCRVDGGPSFM